MNQVDTNLGISEGHTPQTARTYAGAASTSHRNARSPSSSASSDPLITKCDTMYRSPDLSGDINLHVRSNIPRTLVFFIPRRVEPARFHVALSKQTKTDTHRIVQDQQPNAHRIDICFPADSMEQFNLVQQQGIQIDGSTYTPVVPVSENANIIKISLRYLPPHFTKDDLLTTFRQYGTVLQAGRYFNDCGENIRAFTGAGYLFLQQTTSSQATAIPSSFDVGPFLRLQAKVVMMHRPPEQNSDKQTHHNTPNAPNPPSSSPSNRHKRNKRNKRGKKKQTTDMEGIEATGTGLDNPIEDTPLLATAAATTEVAAATTGGSSATPDSDILQQFITYPEESGTVTPVQTTPPAVSLNPEPLPPTPVMDRPGQNLAAMDLREHQNSENEDDDDSSDSGKESEYEEPLTEPLPQRPQRSAAPQKGELGWNHLVQKSSKQK